MIDFSQFDSLVAMTMYFNNEDTCRQALFSSSANKLFNRFLDSLID